MSAVIKLLLATVMKAIAQNRLTWQAEHHRVKHARLPVIITRLQHKELGVAQDACRHNT
jgi:hypothetical protein